MSSAEAIINKPHRKKLIVFGTGKAALEFHNNIRRKIDFYLDNDQDKWNNIFLGRRVKDPSVLLSENLGDIFVIIASSFSDEIAAQLDKMGLCKKHHYIDSATYLLFFKKIPLTQFLKVIFYSFKEILSCILAYFFNKELFHMLVFKLRHGGYRIDDRIKLYFWFGKYIEYPKCMKYLKPQKGENILDIGSGVGFLFFPFWLLSFGCKVFSVDLFKPDIGIYYDLPVVKANKERLVMEKQDAKCMTYESNCFDKITCICSIEHENDDSRVMKEIERVLKVNGIAVLTFPINKEYKEIRNNENWDLIRLYDYEAIMQRLVNPTRLSIENIEFWKITSKYSKSWEGGMNWDSWSALKSLFYYKKVNGTSEIDNFSNKKSYGFDICVLVLKKTLEPSKKNREIP